MPVRGGAVHLARLGGAALRYVLWRRRLPGLYSEGGLDDLLVSLSRSRLRGPLPLSRVALAVRVAERLAPRVAEGPNTCLFRALARYAVLVERGHAPAFVLGVRETGELPAHAWVEISGAAFLEPGPLPFVSVYRQGRGV